MAQAVISAKDLPGIIARLQGGGSLINESKGLGFTHNGPLRGALREFLGTAKYNVLMEAKRPVARVSSTGRRATDRVPVARPSDDGLPIVESMRKDEGWSWRHVPEHAPVPRKVELREGTATVMDTGDRILIVTSPEGIEYTQSFDHEQAHLLRINSVITNGVPVRFTRWDVSARRQRVEKGLGGAEELQKHVEAINARKGKKVTEVVLDLDKPVDAKFVAAAFAAGAVTAQMALVPEVVVQKGAVQKAAKKKVVVAKKVVAKKAAKKVVVKKAAKKVVVKKAAKKVVAKKAVAKKAAKKAK